MTAHDVSDLNHALLQSDNLCAVIDRAYRGIDSIQKFLIRYMAVVFPPRPHLEGIICTISYEKFLHTFCMEIRG